jgi:excisionase family DNA binding protein
VKTKSAEIRGTLKVREAAALAGCGERAIRDGVKAGRIPTLKLNRNILIPRASFQRLVDSGSFAT